jgi:putative alpha-1,2-mannosidase
VIGLCEPFNTADGGPGVGMAVRFRVKAGDVVQLKLAISYCGRAQARRNRKTELADWDFDRVRLEARETWNQWLGRIEVEGGSDAQKTKFYTDLFHALKGRRRVSDADGSIWTTPAICPSCARFPWATDGRPLYEHHNSDAFWGAAWSLNLLWSLAWPEVTHSFCNTLVDMYRTEA